VCSWRLYIGIPQYVILSLVTIMLCRSLYYFFNSVTTYNVWKYNWSQKHGNIILKYEIILIQRRHT